MAIYFPPPPVFIGGQQPYGHENLPPTYEAVVETDNPPFRAAGRTAQQQAITQINQPDPWVYLISAFGPYGYRKVNPNNLSIEVDNPPFTYGGPVAGKMEIVAQAQDSPFTYAPWQYQFLRSSRQPYGPGQLFGVPGLSINNPPFQGAPRSLVAISEAALIAQPDPWVYLIPGQFSGPYGYNKLNPSSLSVTVNNPPFTYGGPIAGMMAIVEQAQASPFNYTPWQYQFFGNQQPYGPARLSPGAGGFTLDPPPFRDSGRGPAFISQAAIAAQPDPWVYLISGPFGPYGYNKLNPKGLSADPPPFQEAGRSPAAISQAAISAQPDPWIYASLGLPGPYGGRIEAIPLGVEVDNPPFTSPGKTAQQQTLFQINQPELWGYIFDGARQPYQGPPPTPPPTPPPPPPLAPPGAGKKPSVTGIYPDAAWDKKPNKPFKPVWDYGGEVEKPKAAPAPAVGPRPITLPPPSIYGGKQQRAVPLTGANPLNLPNFDHLVPPNPVGIGNSLKEAQDMTDAVAVLRALGVIK